MDCVVLNQSVTVNCKVCKRFLLEISSFDKPFKPNANGVTLSVKCYHCDHLNDVSVVNGVDDVFIATL